jgi:hypothetical protein
MAIRLAVCRKACTNACANARLQVIKNKVAKSAAVLLLSSLSVLLSSCATVVPSATGETAVRVSPFSAARGAEIVAGWQQWIMSRLLNRTQYRTIQDEGVPVIEARAESAASGLLQEVSIDPAENKYISWRWKTSSLIPTADNTRRGKDDSPVRIVVAFDGDKSKFDFEDRATADMVKLFSGREMPYATLMYIWENKQPVGTVLDNHNTGRAKMIVAESGAAKVGQWVALTRNVQEDYRRAFGEEPGRIISVGVMTDTNTTQSNITAYYGDISFLSAISGAGGFGVSPASTAAR